jgi:hypothetical protein
LPRGGFLSCFHQSGSGSITQILPSKPDVAFAVGKGQEILLPDPNDGFDIIFETKGFSEAVLCILEVSKKPADLSDFVGIVPLAPTKARSFEHLISKYRERGGNIMWGQVKAKG